MVSILLLSRGSLASAACEFIRDLAALIFLPNSPISEGYRKLAPHLSSAPYTSKPVLNPQDAIASHVRWKIALLLANQMHEPLTDRALQAIRSPGDCLVGKWLVSEHTLHLRRSPEYRAVFDLHTAFHGQMLRIANLLQTGDFPRAERLLNAPGPFQIASHSLANAIMALNRRARPRVAP
jgi:hypothetical protein